MLLLTVKTAATSSLPGLTWPIDSLWAFWGLVAFMRPGLTGQGFGPQGPVLPRDAWVVSSTQWPLEKSPSQGALGPSCTVLPPASSPFAVVGLQPCLR